MHAAWHAHQDHAFQTGWHQRNCGAPGTSTCALSFFQASVHMQSHPAYHKAVQAGSESVSNIQGTSLYKNAKDRLYPSVAPYADPALDKLQANGYYQAAVDHLKPVNSNGKLT